MKDQDKQINNRYITHQDRSLSRSQLQKQTFRINKDKSMQEILLPHSNHRKYKLSQSQLSKLTKNINQNISLKKDNKIVVKTKRLHQSRINTIEPYYFDNNEEIKQNQVIQRLNESRDQSVNNNNQNNRMCNNNCKQQQDYFNHETNLHLKIQKQKIFLLPSKQQLHIRLVKFDHYTQQKQTQTQSQNKQAYTYQKQKQPIFSLEIIQIQLKFFQTSLQYHLESQYQKLSNQLKSKFKNLQQLYEYIVNLMNKQKSIEILMNENIQFQKNKKSFVFFNHHIFCLFIKVYQISMIKLLEEDLNSIQKKQKYLKLQMIPCLNTHIVLNALSQSNHHQEQQTYKLQQSQITHKNNKNNQSKQTKQLQLLKSKQLIHQLEQQINRLKQTIITQQQQIQKQKIQKSKQKSQKQYLLQQLQQLKQKNNQYKQYFYQIIPDTSLKSFPNFKYKNNTIIKINHDLKWDQILSETPLPKSGRHYFTCFIEHFNPDFMFGICTSKIKDTINGFLSLDTLCIYASKNNCHIYQRGKHYKVSTLVKKNDLVVCIVDFDKKILEWVKKTVKNYQDITNTNNTNNTNNNSNQQKEQRQNLTSIFVSKRTQNQVHFPLNRNQSIKSFKKSTNSLQQQDQNEQQIKYLHSVKLPDQFLQHQLYVYLQVYNINDKIRLNMKK